MTYTPRNSGSADLAFDFNRESDHVWATVDLGFDFYVVVASDLPYSPRVWTIEEVQIPGEITRATIKSPSVIPYECELGRALAGAWDRHISREGLESRL